MRTKIALLAAALLPAAALANGYDVPSVTPRDLALVESGTAAQRDAGATYGNPAALSKVRGLSLNLAGSFLDLKTDWSPPAGSVMAGSPEASTKFKPVPPVALYAAYGFELAGRGTGVGLGMNVPGGGNVFWNEDWAGRGRIITVDRKVYGFYLTAGHQLTEWLRVGGGLVYYYTTEYLKQGVQPNGSSYGELATRGGAPSFDLSVELQPSERITVGADFKYRATQTLEGDGKFVVPSAFLQPTSDPNDAPPVDQGVRHDLTYPDVFNVGVAVRATKALQLTAVYTLTGYHVYSSDTFIGDKGTTIDVPRGYADGHTFRFGAEYDLNERLTLRAGLLRDLSGLKEETYSPTLPDADAWAGALGAGWKITPDLAVGAAFFYALMDEVRTKGDEVMPGVYDTRVYIASVGVSWRTDLGGGAR